MNQQYINIYNNLVNFSRNKDIYSMFTKNDSFSDRLIILMFHFAFFLKNFKNKQNKEELQNIYDYFFRQLELSLREIGYGDQTINKKMKVYINTFHSIILDVEKWEAVTISDKNHIIQNYIGLDINFDKLLEYFDKYINFLKNNPFNLFIKSVIKTKI